MSDAVQIVAALGGELITYLPYGGTAKTFKALVERRPSQIAGTPAGSFPVNTMQITFPMDAADGVLTVQPGKDSVRFKRSLSDSDDREFVVNKVIQEDEGFVGTGGMFTVMVHA